MTDHLNEDENLLESAFTQAFSAPVSRRQSMRPDSQAQFTSHPTDLNQVDAGLRNASASNENPSLAPSSDEAVSSESEASWKAEYEAHVHSWRAQSSEARDKAEAERKRWESVRAAERDEAERLKASSIADEPTPSTHSESEWESVGSAKPTGGPSSLVSRSPSLTDARDLVTGEHERQFPLPSVQSAQSPGLQRTHSQQDTADGSQKWEDVHSSMTSSLPSMSFPERTETPSPSHQHPAPPAAPLSATLAIFDSTLSPRTRVTALFSSLAINMLLPFVNGVMLGFGEIFAKNIVMEWFGWKPSGPGSAATTAGIGVSSRRQWSK